MTTILMTTTPCRFEHDRNKQEVSSNLDKNENAANEIGGRDEERNMSWTRNICQWNTMTYVNSKQQKEKEKM